MRAVLVLLSLLVLAPAADAAVVQPRLRPLESNAGVVLTDTSRHVAWSHGRQLTVLDGVTGRRVRRRLPEGCDLNAGSNERNLRGHLLILYCRRGERLLNWRTGRAPYLPREGSPTWFGVGRFWIQGDDVRCPGEEVTCSVFLRRGNARLEFRRDSGFDIDRKELPPLRACGAILRPLTQRLDRPWLVGGKFVINDAGDLWLHRCGSDHSRRLSTAAWRDARVGGGRVHWRERRTVRLYDIADRRTYWWRVPAGTRAYAAGPTMVAATPTGESCDKLCSISGYRLRYARVG